MPARYLVERLRRIASAPARGRTCRAPKGPDGKVSLSFRRRIRRTGFAAVAIALVGAILVVELGRAPVLESNLTTVGYLQGAHADRYDGERPTDADRLVSAVRQMREEVRGLLSQRPTDRNLRSLTKTRSQLDRALEKVRGDFRRDRTKLGKLGADAALARLARIQRAVDSSARALDRALDSPARPSSRGLRSSLRALDGLSPVVAQPALSSSFGFGSRDSQDRRAPLSVGVTPAYAVPTADIAASTLPREPGPGDLTPIEEAQVTPEISELASQLEGDPVRIYQFVRNEIQFEPYYGVRKGAAQTLVERSGSDADQAALTVALMRAANIPARMVHGVVELPTLKAANWLGLAADQPAAAAAEILAAGGYPTTAIRSGGTLTKVRFEHFWVEAHVERSAYRGVDERGSGARWAAIDPSIKATAPSPAPTFGRVSDDDAREVSERFAAAAHQDSSGAVTFSNLEGIKADVQQLSESVTAPALDELLADPSKADQYLPQRQIVRAERSPYLPDSLPARVVSVLGEYRSLPASLKATVSITVQGSDPRRVPSATSGESGELRFASPTYGLAGKRISLSYAPASAEDEAVVASYGGLLATPSYAANLRPVVRVGGEAVGTSDASAPVGYLQRFAITYREPGFEPMRVENPVAVGAMTALSLDLGVMNAADLAERASSVQSALAGTTAENALSEGRTAAFLALIGDFYFLRGDATNAAIEAATGVYAQRALSGALTATSLRTAVVGGFPVSISMDGVDMDVDADNQVVIDPRSDPDRVERYLTASGASASEAEAGALESMFGGHDAVSTSRVIAAAAEQQIPLITVTPSNASETLSALNVDDATMMSVREAVRAGATVTIPARAVSVGGWSGHGYVVSVEGRREYQLAGRSGAEKEVGLVATLIAAALCLATIVGFAIWTVFVIAPALYIVIATVLIVLLITGLWLPALIILPFIFLLLYWMWSKLPDDVQDVLSNAGEGIWDLGAVGSGIGVYLTMCKVPGS